MVSDGGDKPSRDEQDSAETTAVFYPDQLSEASVPAAVEHDQIPGTGTALLVVKRGPTVGARFQLDRAIMSAGRHPDNEIVLDDVTVSRQHAEFRCDGDTVQVLDQGSLNGTYVNRQPVESAELADGDEVQIGKFRLLFMLGRQARGESPTGGGQ